MEIIEHKNYQFCQDTIQLKEDIEGHFLELGHRLYKINNDRLYESGYESFDEYCLELKMSRGTISKLINIYSLFILKYEFDNKQLAGVGGWTVIAEVLPLIKTKKDASYWLEKASLFSRRDLRIAITESKTGIDQYKCKHNDSFSINICNKCGYKTRLYEKEQTKK